MKLYFEGENISSGKIQKLVCNDCHYTNNNFSITGDSWTMSNLGIIGLSNEIKKEILITRLSAQEVKNYRKIKSNEITTRIFKEFGKKNLIYFKKEISSNNDLIIPCPKCNNHLAIENELTLQKYIENGGLISLLTSKKTENELYKKAEKLYHSYGKEHSAIKAYKELLSNYPENIQGWSDLATMQFAIGDYNEAIKSSKKGISLNPKNAWDINTYLIKLKLISKFTFQYPNMFFDEQKRVAYEINELKGKDKLIEEISKIANQLIDLNKNDLSKVYSLKNSLASSYSKSGKHKEAIKCLKKVLELFDYNDTGDNKGNVFVRMSNSYSEIREYEMALKMINKGLELGVRDVFLLKKVEILKKIGENEKSSKTLYYYLDKIILMQNKKPETAYIYQKFTVYKLLNLNDRMKELITEFDNIENQTEYVRKSKQKLKGEITNYLQHKL